jgi:hypothetical protein
LLPAIWMAQYGPNQQASLFPLHDNPYLMHITKHSTAFAGWADEIRRRLPEAFSSRLFGATSPLAALLPALFRHHVDDPRFANIIPPLPGLPRIGLQDWVELRVVPDKRLGRFQPVVMEGHPIELTKSTLAVERLMQESDPQIIVGEPGCGKSTISLWVAQRMILRPSMRPIVPLHIPLSRFVRWKEQNAERSVYHFFWESVLHLPAAAADEFHDYMLLVEGDSEPIRSQFQVLLDGWDETPRHLQSDLMFWVERFEHTLPTMMTSRPVAYGTELPSWVRHEVAPLTFGAMWQVISRLATGSRKPWLTADISEHLDRHPGLRLYARNPFVLTLIFAVASSSGDLPRAKARLYAAAVEFMRQYCNSTQRVHGVSYSKVQVEETQLAALELLRRSDAAPYEFREDEAAGELFRCWRQARMVTPTGDDDGGHRFVHASLHESLAGIGIARKLARDQITLNENGLTVAWLETLRFTFGALDDVPTAAQERLVAWLSRACQKADVFGIVLAHAAELLAEAGLAHRAAEVLGHDAQYRLWEAFLHAPDPRLYAQALVHVGLDYALAQLRELSSVSTDLVARISLLYFLTPDGDSRRREFIMLLAKPLSDPNQTSTGFAQFADLETALGYAPDEGSSVASSQDSRSAVELIAEIAGLRGNPLERPSLMALARSQTTEAESYLVQELRTETDTKRLSDLAEALQQLGSTAARDGMIDSLTLWDNRPEHLAIVLRGLIGLFVDRSAEIVLRYVGPEWPEEVRIAAAHVFAHCDRARILNQLADKARMQESNPNVRKAVLVALSRSRSFGLLNSLNQESSRSDAAEQELIWQYLGALARQISSTRDHGQQRSTVERLFVHELERIDVPPLRLMEEAASLKSSAAIAARLTAVLEDDSADVIYRAGALKGLGQLHMLPPIADLMKSFAECATSPGNETLATAYATVIAQTKPELLLGSANRIARTALWEFSLTTNRLVYADRIQSVVEPLLAERRDADPTVIVGNAPAIPEGAQVQSTIENLAAVTTWIEANLDDADFDAPLRRPEETQLMVAWMASHDLTRSRKAAYRAAALFSSCHGMSFPIVDSEWDARGKAIFKRGLNLLSKWPALVELIGIDLNNEVDSTRRAYQRACHAIDQQRPLERPHSFVVQADLPQSHRNKPGDR